MAEIAESAATLSQDAEAKGEETFLVDKLSISFCGWRDAVYARGDSIFASFYMFCLSFWIFVLHFDLHFLISLTEVA